jgi:hypothetical protein
LAIVRTVFAILILAALAGCISRSAPQQRGKLSGKVTLDGKPVASGRISFIALDASGANAAAPITNGEYSLAEGEGPAKGKYRVQFSVPSATKRRIPNDDVPGQFIEEASETLPPRYHRESAITLDYDPATPQPFNYDLTTR